ncbi:hypothetical protein VSWAT3_04101 [Vibrionales bacterium SWAT-3]|nr:hypothetical protein VSWAT3_04101 [Vibrionales bacterium SWAT-3]
MVGNYYLVTTVNEADYVVYTTDSDEKDDLLNYGYYQITQLSYEKRLASGEAVEGDYYEDLEEYRAYSESMEKARLKREKYGEFSGKVATLAHDLRMEFSSPELSGGAYDYLVKAGEKVRYSLFFIESKQVYRHTIETINHFPPYKYSLINRNNGPLKALTNIRESN